MPKYSKTDLDVALEAINEGYSYRNVCERFNVPKSTLHDKIKKKYASEKVGCPTALSAEIEAMLVKIIGFLARWRCPVDKIQVRTMVKDFLDKRNVTVKVFNNNTPGETWVSNFIKRHNLMLRLPENPKPARASVTEEELTEYFENLRESLAGVPPSNIYNYDETYLSDDPRRKRVLVPRRFFDGNHRIEKKQEHSKQSFSVMFCGNAVGRYIPPMVIYKAKNVYSNWQEGGPENAVYGATTSGWFNNDTFTQWFFEVFIKNVEHNNAPIVIIGDNLGAHFSEDVINYCVANNIRFVTMPPNSTHLCQPLDEAVFKGMKSIWTKILRDWRLLNPVGAIDKAEFPGLLKKLCSAVTSCNLISGFRATGIFPLVKEQVVKRIPTVASLENDDTDEAGPSIKDCCFSAAVINQISATPPPTKKRRGSRIAYGKPIEPKDMEKMSVFSDKAWVCCRCKVHHAKRGEKSKWIACDECDRVFHLKCSGVVYVDEALVNIEVIDFKCDIC